MYIPIDADSAQSIDFKISHAQVHWMKLPLKFREVSEFLTHWLSEKAISSHKNSDNGPENANSRCRLLLVDDSEENRMLIQAYLKNEAFDITTAKNGREAVEQVQKDRFDLVLMDVQMPVMDGLTATRTIRKWEQGLQLKQVPIIALTAHALREEEEKSFQAGCQGHLTKPIKKAFLIQYLKQFLLSTSDKKESAA